MFPSKLIRSAAALAAMFSCGAVFAADAKDLAVSATVTGVCKLQTVPAMAFTLDPSAASDTTETSVVTYKCTKGTAAPTVLLGPTGGAASPYSGTLVGSGTAAGESIAYKVTWTDPTLVGAGFSAADQSFTLSGEVLGTSYAGVKAGPYATTVSVNITP